MKICKIPHDELGRLTDPKGSYCFMACSGREKAALRKLPDLGSLLRAKDVRTVTVV